MVDSRKSLVDPKTVLRTGLPLDFDFLNMRFASDITASLPQGGIHNPLTIPYRGDLVLS